MKTQLVVGAVLAIVGGFVGKVLEVLFDQFKTRNENKRIFCVFLDNLKHSCKIVFENHGRTKTILPSQLNIISTGFNFYDRNIDKIMGYVIARKRENDFSRWLERVYTAFVNVQSANQVILTETQLPPSPGTALLVEQAKKNLPDHLQELKAAIDEADSLKERIG